jgi:hypothetical protein
MKICFKCDEPIDEEGEDPYVMLITKKKGKIMDFICFHFGCWQKQNDEPVLGKTSEKMSQCSICKKKLRFWNSYVDEGNYFCKDCWGKKEGKIEESRQEKVKERGDKSRKTDDSSSDSQKTL